MTTVADLVVRASVDPSGVGSGFAAAQRYHEQYAAQVTSLAAQLDALAVKGGAAQQRAIDSVIASHRSEIAAINDERTALASLQSQQLDTANGLGAFRASIDKTALSTLELPKGFGRVNQGMISLVAQATSTIPVLDRVGFALLQMSGGSVVALGVIAGIAAIAYGYQALTANTREATQALEDYQAKARQSANAGQADQLTTQARQLYYGSPFSDDGKTAAKVSQRVKGAFEGSFADLQAKRESLQQQLLDAPDRLMALATQRDINRLDSVLKPLSDKLKALHDAATNVASQPADNAGHLLGVTVDAKSDATIQKEYLANLKLMQQGLSDFIDTQDKQVRSANASIFATRQQADDMQRMVDATAQGPAAVAALTDQLQLEGVQRDFLAKYSALDDDQRAGRLQALLDETKRIQDLTHVLEDMNAEKAKAAQITKDQQQAIAAAAKSEADQIRETTQLVKSEFTSLFTDIVTRGKDAFASLFSVIENGFIRVVADIAASDVAEKIVQSGALAFVMQQRGGTGKDGSGLSVGGGLNVGSLPPVGPTGASIGQYATGIFGAGLAGYGIGSQTGSTGMGLLGGAAAGALAGSIAGPMGAAAGALVGAATGLLGAASAQRDAAAAQKAAALATTNSIQTYITGSFGNDKASQTLAENQRYASLLQQLIQNSPMATPEEQQRLLSVGDVTEAHQAMLGLTDGERALLDAHQRYLDAINGTTDALTALTGAATNVPSWYNINSARWAAAMPDPATGVNNGGATGGPNINPKPGGGTGASASYSIYGDITIQGSQMSVQDLFTAIAQMAQQKSSALFGTSSRAGDALALVGT